MRLGIDASNIRYGGGITHLVELLRTADPCVHGVSQVIVWGGQATLSRIEGRPWLVKSHHSLLDKNLIYRIFWQCFRLSMLVRIAGCDLLFVPGGSYAGDFYPMVTMSQNMLPFEWRELWRFGFSWMTIRLLILRLTQAITFSRANGIIFLTQYARSIVMKQIGRIKAKITIVPHGIDQRFFASPRVQLPIDRYSKEQPYRILYVSTIDVYKHQGSVVQAVGALRKSGLPVVLSLVGSAYPPALKRLNCILRQVDPMREFGQYSGAVRYDDLQLRYAQADLCLFASSCENMPNILLEAMASGLPLACSSRGPMPEILGNAGIYFDPEKPDDIARALRELINSPDLRAEKARFAFKAAQPYSWERCARETFGFLANVVSANDDR